MYLIFVLFIFLFNVCIVFVNGFDVYFYESTLKLHDFQHRLQSYEIGLIVSKVHYVLKWDPLLHCLEGVE